MALFLQQDEAEFRCDIHVRFEIGHIQRDAAGVNIRDQFLQKNLVYAGQFDFIVALAGQFRSENNCKMVAGGCQDDAMHSHTEK